MNRRLQLTPEFFEQNNLNTDPPPPDSIFWDLWQSTYSLAQQILALPFIQGIAQGSLDPVKYGAFIVSDSYYCFRGADDYRIAASRVPSQMPTLQKFLMAKYTSYSNYNQYFTDTWHISSANYLNAILPTQAAQDYADFENNVATQLDPIYTLVVMIPCEYLWWWLASRMNPDNPPNNLYKFWITDNNPTPLGAYAMGNYLDDYIKSGFLFDPRMALNVYSRAMEMEANNFATAVQALQHQK